MPEPGWPDTSTGPVLFVSHSAIWGGAERILLDTASGLEGPVAVLCPEGALAERARSAGLPVLAAPAHAPELRGGVLTRAGAAAGLAAHAREVARAASALRPRAAVAVGMRSALACAAALRGRAAPPWLFHHLDFLPSPGVARAVRAAARRAHGVIAISQPVAADLDPRGRLGERLRVAAPGIDLAGFPASPPPEGPPLVLLLGAIAPWKRPDLALEAVALAAARLPELRLVVAGHTVGEVSERLLGELRRRASRPDLAGRVEFAGRLADPRPALARASCLLHCTDREPFGLVLLEAMASGRPVAAPAAGGPPEILAEGGGRLYTPGDAQAAADALVVLVSDPGELRRAGERARARVEERYTLPAARRRWMEASGLPTPPPPPAEAGRDLTLVTVSHDSARELERLLASVRRHLPSARVVVADSGSSDESVAVARRSPGVEVIDLENVGFGRATNAGLARVSTPACIVLNPDTELVDGSLAALAAEALRPGTPERLLAPLVLLADGTRQDSVHPEPVSRQAAAVAFVPPAALPASLRRRLQPWRGDRPRPVAWAVGCCVAAPTATLRRLGPFDERIFLYGEDLELGLRAGDAGVETWWWPRARLIHYKGHTEASAFSGEPFELLARQRHAVIAERRGERTARRDDRLQALTLVNRIALKGLLWRPNERERRQLAALRAARGSRLGD